MWYRSKHANRAASKSCTLGLLVFFDHCSPPTNCWSTNQSCANNPLIIYFSSQSNHLPYQRRQFDRGVWWRGRNPWTSQTGGGRRLVGGSWPPNGQPPSGRTQPRSEQTASRSIFPRLRLDFEKTGSGVDTSPCSHVQTTLKLAFFLDCYSLYSSFIHLLSDLDRHPQCPSRTPLVCRMCQASSPIARISVSRYVCLTWVGWVSPWFAGDHDTQPTSSLIQCPGWVRV